MGRSVVLYSHFLYPVYVLNVDRTAWAAGPIWNTSSACCNNQQGLRSLESGTLGSMGEPSQYYDVWLPCIQSYIPVDMKRSGTSGLK